jgi:hypothetical protein
MTEPRVLTDNTASIIATIERNAAELRRETAERIALAASEAAPVDKGALQVSVYVSDETGSDYAAAVSAAQEKNPKVEVLVEMPKEKDTTIISFAVNYALINELTNVAFLGPAVEAARSAFEAEVGKLGLRGSIS